MRGHREAETKLLTICRSVCAIWLSLGDRFALSALEAGADVALTTDAVLKEAAGREGGSLLGLKAPGRRLIHTFRS